MASTRRRLLWNTRERLLSSDLNDATALIHANLADDVCAIVSGDLYKSSIPLSGVVAGGVVTADGVSLVVSISPMVAFKNGTPSTSLDSPYLRVETISTETIDLTAYVDPGNDRWVCIEVAPGDTDELISARDIFNPVTGTFSTANVTKIKRSEPTFAVNAGTPAATPQLPLGNPDVIPLAYVYLPAAAAAVGVNDVVLCRPIFNGSTREALNIIGKGGIDVTSPGGNNVLMKAWGIKFDGLGFPMQVPFSRSFNAGIAGSPNWVSGEAYPAAGDDEPIYCYLMSAPYPSGYDADVASNREYQDSSGRIPSNPYNVLPVQNCLAVFSSQPPAFALNPVGYHPTASLALNDTVWNGGTSNFHAYAGAASFHSANAPQGLAVQFTYGDRVRIRETAKLGEDYDTQSNSSVAAQAGVFRNLSPMLNNNAGKGLAVVLPDALEYDVIVEEDETGSGASYFMQAQGNADVASGPPDRGTFYASADNSAGDAYIRRYGPIPFRTDQTGGFTFSHSELGLASSTFRMIVVGYQDRILALR